MSKDTIYRQDAIDAIERAKTAQAPNGEIYVAKLNAEMNIQILPSAQHERKKGRWIGTVEDWRNQIVWWGCSECGMDVSTRYNYCPDCGADMRGE